MTSSSHTIDLTDSPPQRHLSQNATPGPSRQPISNTTSSSQTTISNNLRDQEGADSWPQVISVTRSSPNRTGNRRPASVRQHGSSAARTPTLQDFDDEVSFVSMSEGARREMERSHATRTATAAAMAQLFSDDWVNSFLATANGTGSDVRVVPDNQIIHEGIPPGPRAAETNARRRAELDADMLRSFLLMSNSPSDLEDSLGILGANWQNTGHREGDVESLSRTASAFSPSNLPKVTSMTFQPSMLNAHKPASKSFSYGIIEPPVEIETYEENPNLITGPLPETTPICAGCDHALVLGGSGAKRVWVLPCGHVIDGTCLDRFSGAAAYREKQFAKACNSRDKGEKQMSSENTRVIVDEAFDPVAEDAFNAKSNRRRPTSNSITGGSFKVLRSARLQDASTNSRISGTEVTPNDTDNSDMPPAGNADPNFSASVPTDGKDADSSQDHSTLFFKDKHNGLFDESSTPYIRKPPLSALRPFVCPVSDCGQRCNPVPGKPTSPIELYI